MCHQLHTVLEKAWKQTREENHETAAYEYTISELSFCETIHWITQKTPQGIEARRRLPDHGYRCFKELTLLNRAMKHWLVF